MTVRTAEHPRPSHFLVHISDTHLVGNGDDLYGAVDSEARLRRILAELAASHARPDALVFTGDLADRGEPEAYRPSVPSSRPSRKRWGHRLSGR